MHLNYRMYKKSEKTNHNKGFLYKARRYASRCIDRQYFTYTISPSSAEKELILRKKALRDFVFGVTAFITLALSFCVYAIYPKEKTVYFIVILFLSIFVMRYAVEIYYMLTSKIPYMVRINDISPLTTVVFYEKKGVVFYFEITLILVFCFILLTFIFFSIPFVH